MNDQSCHEHHAAPRQRNLVPPAIVIAAALLSGAWLWTDSRGGERTAELSTKELAALEAAVLPSDGIELPVRWGDLGTRLVEAGVIDQQKFEQLYAQRGGLEPDERALLEESGSGSLRITPNNADVLLNVLWALGLANKNPVLTNGMMQDKQFGGAQNFASTGGWTLARGSAMSHYAMHQLMTLTDDQQALVERVAGGIYRPCCGNSTAFPDCNHGMAMLGLLELMASQGATEEQMYETALRVNAYWFPDTYLTIARYLSSEGTEWDEADPKTILGADYSSAQGFRRIADSVAPAGRGGNSCGV